jgi:endoglucanase
MGESNKWGVRGALVLTVAAGACEATTSTPEEPGGPEQDAFVPRADAGRADSRRADASRPDATGAPDATAAPDATGARDATLDGAVTAPGLHVSGGAIVDEANRPVQLHGVNFSGAEYSCLDKGGSIWDGPANAATVAAMKSWNVNAVRIPLNEDCWLGINGVSPALSGDAYRSAIAAFVKLLAQSGIASIVNLHFSAPGTELARDQQAMADRDHSVDFWRSAAQIFKGDGLVLFEPYNEPYPGDGEDTAAAWECWKNGGACAGVPFAAAGMQELVTTIRETGAANIIIATGNNYGSQLSQWVKYRPSDPLGQLAAGWHTYHDGLDCDTPACWNSTLAEVLAVAPIVATEIGQFDCKHDYIDTVMAFLDSKSQSYLAWTWGPFDCAKDPALLTDWDGTPTQTFGQGFKDHILQRP